MTCGPLQFGCQLGEFIAPYWGWLQIAFWCVVGLGLLWALSAIKNIGGWGAVAATLGALAYAFGWQRGKRDKPLIPRIDSPTDIDGPDADPPIHVAPVKRKPLFPNAPWNKGN